MNLISLLSATKPKVGARDAAKRSAVRNYYAYQLCSVLTQQKKLIMWFTHVQNNNKETDTLFEFFQLVSSFSDFPCAKWQYKDHEKKIHFILRSGHTERGLPQRTAVSVRCGTLHSKQTLLTIIFWKHSS